MNDQYPSNGPSAATLRVQQTDLSHHMHPFTDHQEMAGEGGPRVITRAEGVYIWDSDGNRLLDGMAGLWCVNVGYGRAELIQAAQRQMQELPYYNTFFKTTTPVRTRRDAKYLPGPGRITSELRCETHLHRRLLLRLCISCSLEQLQNRIKLGKLERCSIGLSHHSLVTPAQAGVQ